MTALDVHRANGEHVQKRACTTTKKLITICWHESENNFSGSVLTAVIFGFESRQHLWFSKYCNINMISLGQTSIRFKVREKRAYLSLK